MKDAEKWFYHVKRVLSLKYKVAQIEQKSGLTVLVVNRYPIIALHHETLLQPAPPCWRNEISSPWSNKRPVPKPSSGHYWQELDFVSPNELLSKASWRCQLVIDDQASALVRCR